MEILEKNGYAVTLKEYGSFFELCHQIFAIDHCYYHAHDFLAMALGTVLRIFRKYIFIKDYHQLLLPPIISNTADRKINFYEQPETWGVSLAERDENRFEKIVELVPEGVKNILDIGCGTGELVLRLQRKMKSRTHIVEVDRSATALSKCNADVGKISADINALPFKDKTFDLVICAEVLEHLSTTAMRDAINKIKKISSKYVIIGVPNNENLAFSMYKCYECGNKFHINLHKRSFKLGKMKKLFFPELNLKKYVFGGAERVYYNNILLWVKQNIAGVWLRKINTLCPFCGAQQKFQGLKERNAISWRCDTWNKRIRQRTGSQQSHIMALYAKD
ncbi:MAG: class I SAM-dependent methyltransferase [Candidatus Omnitrophica bacterium]|nr:class I SAM-dependent methyltransferase [Candidatus Omnitrophota bacterium]